MPVLKRVALIMAGGSGERFWPLSRSLRPKQFLRIDGSGDTLLEQAVAAVEPLIPAHDIHIATGEALAEATRALLPHIPDANYILEPERRNTAGCLILAAARFLASGDDADATIAVLAADHHIADTNRFRQVVHTALTAAEREDALVTLGIAPDRPETGYGYIEVAGETVGIPGSDGIEVHPVSRFREKPDRETAASYIATGRFLWNSGMFFWRLPVFLRELDAASPGLGRTARDMADAIAAGNDRRLGDLFRALPAISIDYALMEKARRVLVVRADFGWDDIGAWDVLDRTAPRDDMGNVAIGSPVMVDCRDCIVVNHPGPGKNAVAVVGVEGLAVVVTEDAVLVIPKDRAQDVRKAVAELKKRGSEQV